MESLHEVMRPIVLSAGHNPKAKGAKALGHVEYDLTCYLVGLLAEELLEQGIPVVVVDSTLSLQERITWVLQRYPESLALEIHFNAFNGKAEGTELFYKVGDKVGFDIGKKFLIGVSHRLNLKNRGMKLSSFCARGSLAWTSQLNHGLLWEVCFMDNPDDLAKILPMYVTIKNIGMSLRGALLGEDLQGADINSTIPEGGEVERLKIPKDTLG